jgi:hypothetical protein
MPQPSAPNRLNGTVCVVCVHRIEEEREREKRYPCGFFMKSRDSEGGLCTRETCGGSEEEKRNSCKGGIGEYTETATHPKQPKKLGGLKFSLLMFPFWYPKNVVCAPESEEGGKQPPYSYTHTTPENEKVLCQSIMHRELYIMGCAFGLATGFSFFHRILKQLPPRFLIFLFFDK